MLIIVTMIFNFTVASEARPWAIGETKQSSKKMSKVVPSEFVIPEEKLSNVEQVDEMLAKKRLSVIR